MSAPSLPVQFAQTNVAMGYEQAHAKLLSEGESLTIVGFSRTHINRIFAGGDPAEK